MSVDIDTFLPDEPCTFKEDIISNRYLSQAEYLLSSITGIIFPLKHINCCKLFAYEFNFWGTGLQFAVYELLATLNFSNGLI